MEWSLSDSVMPSYGEKVFIGKWEHVAYCAVTYPSPSPPTVIAAYSFSCINTARDWKSVLPYNSQPNPQCDSIRRSHLWEDGALMNGISAPTMREIPERSLVPFHHVRTQWDDGCLWLGKQGSYQTLHLVVPWLWTSQPSELWETNFYCL